MAPLPDCNVRSEQTARAEIVSREISAAAVVADMANPDCGAVVTFIGAVRNHDGGRPVTALRYEHHPSALGILRAVAEHIVTTSDNVRVAVVHRVGRLNIGDIALVAVVSSTHRAEAFGACERLVTQIKADAPIWKHQVYEDGDAEWVSAFV